MEDMAMGGAEMEERTSFAPSFSSPPSSSSLSSDDQAKQAFALLQPLCSRLLELPARAKDSSAEDVSLLFKSLLQALHDAPVLGLRICMEYILFPLQLLLDASVQCRFDRSSTSSTSGLLELRISDKIAENVLLCLEKILQSCPLSSASQMSLLLRKLTAAAMLSPDEASEEFRHGALRCLQQMITGLSPCNNSLCSCKDNSLPQHIVLANGCLSADLGSVVNSPSKKMKKSVGKEHVENTEDCLIELLRSKSMSAAVGHLLSLFLQISEVEAQRGSYGSAKLRIDALTTLRTLMLKVRTADALAFFLPGVSSRLVTAMQGSNKLRRQAEVSEVSYPSGAAGSSGAVEQAVRALSELLVLVLADGRNLEGLPAESQIGQSQMSMQGPGAIEEALTTLSEISSCHRKTEMNQFVQHTEMEPKLLPENSIVNKSDESLIGGDMAQSNIFCVTRNAKWLQYTVKQINMLLSLSFPALCRHSVPSVRLAVIHGATMLIITCGHTLEGSKSTLLECLLAMACDEWPSVASAAHLSLTFLVTQSKELKCNLKSNICRLMERLPKIVYSGNESALIFFCRQLVAAMFFAGPDGVSDCLFQSPVATGKFLMVMAQCFSFNSVIASSFKQMSLRQGTLGYIPGISELNSEKLHEKETDDMVKEDACLSDRDLALSQEQPTKDIFDKNNKFIQLPQMPPWLRTGGRRVYKELSKILRLAGLSSIDGDDDCSHLFRVIEELLDPLRQISSLTHKELYIHEVGQMSDYVVHGNWQRTAATAVSLLTEVFYGASGQWVHTKFFLFEGLDSSRIRNQSAMYCQEDQDKLPTTLWDDWKKLAQKNMSRTLCEFVGDILHDYMSSEIWKLPVEGIADLLDRNNHYRSSQAYILRDNAALQQVILESIGVLAQCLGKYFEEQGFLGSVLFIVLEQLGSSHYEISSSADLAVHAISSACGYPSVKALTSASTDYIVDSLCRELRHLDLYPSAPNMLVAALRYTGACQDLLPLLQEPMRIISLELEIPSRQRNSQNIVPMLRALKEIIHAAKGEGQIMQDTNFSGYPSLLTTSEKEGNKARKDAMEYELPGDCTEFKDEHEQFITRLKESQRSRQIVEDITVMCLKACAPLMASRDQHACLLSLEIIKVGFEALSSMDDARKNEKKQIERMSRLLAHQDELTSLDDMEAAKLLPTMHQVWPHIAACLKHTTPSVLVQSLKVIASVTSSCGGEFFSRRLQKDAVPKMLTLLCRGTALQSKSKGGQHAIDNRKMLVHLQGNNPSAPNEFASASLHKVQEAVLDCITEIARSQRASPALQGAFEQVAAVMVGIACAVPSLQESAVQALIALSSIDADLIWILIADVAYGSNLKLKNETSPGPGFPEVSKLLPPVKSDEETLWKQISGNCSFSIDSSMAWGILSRIESCR